MNERQLDLDLRRLRFFVEVVQQGGFSSAAKTLHSTQSTVSKAVKLLEEELGVVLLQRSSTRSELTDEGRLVYEKAQQLLAASSRLERDLDELKGLRRGRLAIGLPRMGTGTLLADALATFKLKYPLVELQVDTAPVGDLHRMLRNLEVEIAVLFEQDGDEFELQPAYEDQLVVLLPALHPLAARASIDLRALGDLPLFLCDEDIAASRMVLEAFDDAGVTPRVAARSSHFELLFELVKSGAGASFVPSRLAAEQPRPSIAAIPLAGVPIPWRFGFAWLRGRYLSHAARAWLAEAVPESMKEADVAA